MARSQATAGSREYAPLLCGVWEMRWELKGSVVRVLGAQHGVVESVL